MKDDDAIKAVATINETTKHIFIAEAIILEISF